MIIKVIGAALIMSICCGFGFSLSNSLKNNMNALRYYIIAIEYMECELQYRLSPLPELCCAASRVTKGCVSRLFSMFANELQQQNSPSVSECMQSVLEKCADLPDEILLLSQNLGERLGVFDVDGQTRMLSSLRMEAQQILNICENKHSTKSRSCKTIAACVGAVIVILLI